jgi:hypothetical protein
MEDAASSPRRKRQVRWLRLVIQRGYNHNAGGVRGGRLRPSLRQSDGFNRHDGVGRVAADGVRRQNHARAC